MGRLSDILNMVYELEGLLTLAINKKEQDEAYERLLALISEKAERIADATFVDMPAPAAPADDAEDPAENRRAHRWEDETPEEETDEEVEDSALEEDALDAEGDPEEAEEEKPDGNALYEEEQMEKEAILRPRMAFSLNDKFRFRRELFNNQEGAFSNAVSLISSFESIDEAEDYVYNELGLDPDKPEVAEFMKIVEKYFCK